MVTTYEKRQKEKKDSGEYPLKSQLINWIQNQSEWKLYGGKIVLCPTCRLMVSKREIEEVLDG